MMNGKEEAEISNNNAEIPTPKWMYCLAVYYLVFMIVSIWGLIQTVFAPLGPAQEVRIPILWFSKEQVPPITQESHLIIISALAGAHGGVLHGLAWLAQSAREQKFDRKHIIWFIQRPFIGAGLAVAIYFIFRSGMLPTASAENFNVYAIAAVGVLTGIAEARAIDKMRELFRTLFASKEKESPAGSSNGDELPEQKIVTSDEFEKLATNGWQYIGTLPSGKIIIKK